MLGRYGDTRVPARPLFDPARDSPPDAAIDVQFRCPVSLSILLDGMTQAAMDTELAAWRRGLEQIAADTVADLQFSGGYVADGERRDLAPARLEVTTVVDDHAPAIPSARWHLHAYVGSTATSLLDGERWAVDYAKLQRAVLNIVHGNFAIKLEELAVEQLDVVWGEPRPGAVREIVEPPWHEHIDTPDRGVCPGRWGPRRLLLADEQSLRLAAESEHWLALARAEGRERTELPLYEPPPLPRPASGDAAPH